MPTTVVSFLGTGQKQNPQDPRSGCRTTTYQFARPGGGEFLHTTSLFGTALVTVHGVKVKKRGVFDGRLRKMHPRYAHSCINTS